MNFSSNLTLFFTKKKVPQIDKSRRRYPVRCIPFNAIFFSIIIAVYERCFKISEPTMHFIRQKQTDKTG